MSISRIALPFVLAFACAAAHAQYVWLDEKGNKQFSDKPPPISVPKNKIIKAPNMSGKPAPAADAAPASAAADDASKLTKPVTTASKNEDYNKRKAEQAEKDKKAEDEKQSAAAKAKNCERARTYQQNLESGARVANVDKNGERNFMDDTQRNQELADVKKTLADCK
ncbi:DUF4124 domain-containing protein [Undibacterium sp. Ji49W]|uniref:DUF4124 domain-containing protein n=1 Tax=Undibacterium sp. Ji49W TaxID=3413040 RepID=UPI003BEF50F7